jgi:hypothetical protein
MRRGTWLIASVAALAFAAPAHAAPVDLGVGSDPSAVIDPAGTAHIVYDSSGGQTYCRLPRNAKACDVLTPLPLADHAGRVKILRRAADGALMIAQGSGASLDGTSYGVTWLRTSVDGGATWQGPSPIGTGLRRLDDLTLSNDGASVFTVSEDIDSLFFQAAPVTGSEARMLDLNAKPDGSPAGSAYRAEIVQTPQGTLVAAIDTITDTLWRVFGGGDLYNQAAWLPFPARKIRGEGDPDLASGPRGTYLMNARSIAFQRRDLAAPFVIRSLDAKRGRWRAPKRLAEDRAVTGTGDLAQDARGRLHVAWSSSERGTSCVVYARTGTRSSSGFGRSTTLFKTRSGERAPRGVTLAAGADGRGVAVWEDPGPSVNAGHVWATALKQRRGRYHRVRDPYDRPDC